jgi:hypothetical protein
MQVLRQLRRAADDSGIYFNNPAGGEDIGMIGK